MYECTDGIQGLTCALFVCVPPLKSMHPYASVGYAFVCLAGFQCSTICGGIPTGGPPGGECGGVGEPALEPAGLAAAEKSLLPKRSKV